MFTGIVYLSEDNYLYVPIPRKLCAAAFMMAGELGMVPPVDLKDYGRIILATPQEIAGQANLVNERGKSINFKLDGTAEEVGRGTYSKLLGFVFKGTDLDRLRTSYGLVVQFPNRYFVPFAARPTSVFRNNAVTKIRGINAA